MKYLSAFPQPFTMDDQGNFYQPMDKDEKGSGMTLRDYFAGQAIVGLLASCAHPQSVGSNLYSYSESPQHAYEIADAMLKAREGKE